MRLSAILATALVAGATLAAPSIAHAQAETNQESNNDQTVEQKVEVERGDTLSGIAKDFETTYMRLFNANEHIEHPDLIFPGDEVRVPHADEELKERPVPENVVATKPQAAKPKPVATPAAPKKVAKPAPKPVAKPAPKKQVAASTTSTSVWDRLAQCESSGNWSINTGNGFYGGLQFTLSSWRFVGGSGYPHHASKSEQIARAEKLKAIQGWGAWPACTAKLGLR